MEQKETYNSLYEYISEKARPFLRDGGEMDFEISDDFKDNESNGIPFADGAYDGIAVYHMGTQGLSDETRELMINALKIASAGDKEAAERAFTELGKSQRAIHVIDPLQDYIIEHKDEIPANRLYEFAVYAITRSCDIECVKFGLSILELLVIDENEELKDVITMLGFSEEFALFALFVMLRWSDGNDRIFRLARKTHGWGRIHAIERLKPETDEIKRWLLREGVHNTVMPGYSAFTCWNKSGAAELLFGDEPLSDEDAKGLRDIIDALLDEGPCAGISEVENADDLLAKFLDKASVRELNIDDYDTVRNIAVHNEDENAEISAKCRGILTSEKCRETVKLAVKEGRSVQLANELGIDCKADILRLLETELEKHCYLCVHLMRDDEYRAKAISLFREKLPLDELKAAPMTEFGLGKEFKKQQCLDAIVQHLGNYPLEGVELVETALQCSPTRNRNIALNVLQAWVNAKQTPLEQLLPKTFALLKKLKELEPDEKVREKTEKLLNGEIEK